MQNGRRQTAAAQVYLGDVQISAHRTATTMADING
jgi:hypothetical protein